MTEKTFEDKFPSLKGKNIDGSFESIPIKLTDLVYGTEELVFKQSTLMKYCLDKQRVKEAIHYLDIADIIKILKDFEGTGEQRIRVINYIDRHFKRELGLE